MKAIKAFLFLSTLTLFFSCSDTDTIIGNEEKQNSIEIVAENQQQATGSDDYKDDGSKD